MTSKRPCVRVSLFLSLAVSLVVPAVADDVLLVSHGGHKLEVRLQGNGDQTFVLESGLGHDLSVWQRVADEICKSARIVSYSRAGYGQSESSDKPRNPEQISTKLHTLLAAEDIK